MVPSGVGCGVGPGGGGVCVCAPAIIVDSRVGIRANANRLFFSFNLSSPYFLEFSISELVFFN
jgi:hypothetical protein